MYLDDHSSGRRRGGLGKLLPALLLMAASGHAAAASIHGQVTDPDGFGLANVPVCLKAPYDGGGCSKLRFTDRKGSFHFKGVKTGSGYSVEVFRDTSASQRRFEAYPTYVWGPSSQPVDIGERSDSVILDPFVGKFNFSNYQRVIRLTAGDFPELVEFDLSAEYVVLKVSFAPGSEEPPETVFLGQVRSADRIRIDASVPLSTSGIDYEIYSAGQSLGGSIALSDG
jgi:hypothetical protein